MKKYLFLLCLLAGCSASEPPKVETTIEVPVEKHWVELQVDRVIPYVWHEMYKEHDIYPGDEGAVALIPIFANELGRNYSQPFRVDVVAPWRVAEVLGIQLADLNSPEIEVPPVIIQPSIDAGKPAYVTSIGWPHLEDGKDYMLMLKLHRRRKFDEVELHELRNRIHVQAYKLPNETVSQMGRR